MILTLYAITESMQCKDFICTVNRPWMWWGAWVIWCSRVAFGIAWPKPTCPFKELTRCVVRTLRHQHITWMELWSMMYTTYMGTPQLWLAGAHLPKSTQRDAPLCSPGTSSSEDSKPFSSYLS